MASEGNSGDHGVSDLAGSSLALAHCQQIGRMPGGVSAIMDLSAMTTTVLMNQQHMYMTMPIPQTANIPDSVHGKIVKTGSEVIAGVPCDDYVGEDAHGQKDDTFCLAHSMGNFAQYSANNPLMKAYAARISGFSSALGSGGFPLKVTKSDGTVQMLATKIEKKSLDASMFTVPAGYTTMQMPAGMQQTPPPQH